LLDKFLEFVAAMPAAERHRYRALFDVTCALATEGIALVDLTPQALLFYSLELSAPRPRCCWT
jgi:hypothetical protein